MLQHLFESPFAEFSLIFLVVFVVATAMRILRQPFIVGFIITGIIFSPQLLGLAHVDNLILISSQLGVALLLFIAGLHLNPYYLKTDGKAIVVAAVGQIALTSAFGYFLATYLGFDHLTSVYLAIALSLSSTIVSLKLLADKKMLGHLHGRLSVGILLIQDVFVAIALIALNALQSESGGFTDLLLSNLAWVIVILVPSILIQRFILPKVLPRIAKSQEYLFIFVISWLLLFATIFEVIGFSLEIGALFGGVLLAPTVFASEISSKIKPLRDFFLIIFFIQLGLEINIDNLPAVIKPVALFSIFTLIVKPLIVISFLGLMGYKSKVSAKTAFSLAQISEFSLILMLAGSAAGVIEEQVSVIVTLVALITIAISTYMITYDTFLLNKLQPLLRLFEWKLFRPKEQEEGMLEPELILIGAKRSGDSIIKALRETKKSFMVIDFNPEVVKSLRKKDVDCVFGDLENLSNMEGINFDKVGFVISTVSDLGANLSALQYLSKEHKSINYLCYAADDGDAIQLYEKGAAFVLVPHHVGGKFVSTLIENYGNAPEDFIKEKLSHLRALDKN